MQLHLNCLLASIHASSPACACCACGRGRIVEHTLDPWISKLVGAIPAKEGSGERYWLGLSIHGFLETNQNGGAEGGGG